MGGGAGITFSNFEMICVEPAVMDFPNTTLSGGKFICDSFDAIGYDDGMTGVDGREMFSNIAVTLGYDALEAVEHWIERWSDGGDITVELTKIREVEDVTLFGGYVRGTLEAGNTLDTVGEVELTIFQNGQFADTVEVPADITFTFDYQVGPFYQDVFVNSYPSEEDLADLKKGLCESQELTQEECDDQYYEDKLVELWYEYWQEDNLVNYKR